MGNTGAQIYFLLKNVIKDVFLKFGQHLTIV